MTFKLFWQAITKFILGVVLVGLLIFIPAGTISFSNGWLLMIILFVPMFLAGIVMMIKNPELLKKRLAAKEKQHEQDIIVKLSGIMFLLGFIIAGLNYRFEWYMLPKPVIIIASIVFIISYSLYAEVLKENTYLSRTIEIQKNHKVIDTGLYSIVRHPMYCCTLLLFISMPIVLGSLYSLIIFLAYPIIVSRRIIHEEKYLQENLDGYVDYMQKVKYRLIPFIW